MQLIRTFAIRLPIQGWFMSIFIAIRRFARILSSQGKEVLQMSEINASCPCPKVKCERHGKCQECRANHEGRKNPSYCLRKTEK